MGRLLVLIFIKGDLLHYVLILCQVEANHDLILQTCFVKIVRNVTTYFFDCKKHPITDSLAFFDSPVAALHTKVKLVGVRKILFKQIESGVDGTARKLTSPRNSSVDDTTNSSEN